MARVVIEGLCTHQDISAFDCGVEALNISLQELHRNHRFGVPSFSFVALVESEVRGFATVQDIEIVDESTTTPGVPALALYICGLAVDSRYHGGEIAAELVRHLYEIRRHRETYSQELAYCGVLATPDINDELHVFLLDKGFSPLPDSVFLYRQFRGRHNGGSVRQDWTRPDR